MAIIFIHSNIDTIKARVIRFIKAKTQPDINVSLDDNVLPDLHILKGEESIKISEIKKLMDELSFKPMQLSKQFGIILNAHMMTSASQNALLKNLEEHPESTEYILSTQDVHLLLPTIVSRCKVRYIKKGFQKSEIPDTSREFVRAPKYQKLSIVKSLIDQKDSHIISSFLTGLLRINQDILTEGSLPKLKVATENIKLIQFIQKYIKQNVNKSLALDYLVIHWQNL